MIEPISLPIKGLSSEPPRLRHGRFLNRPEGDISFRLERLFGEQKISPLSTNS